MGIIELWDSSVVEHYGIAQWVEHYGSAQWVEHYGIAQ